MILTHLGQSAEAGSLPWMVRLDPPSTPPVLVINLDPPTLPAPISKYSLPSKEREVVAACLVLEAADQGEFGMRSVMAVIRNRSRGSAERFAPTTLEAKQFSAFNRLTAGRERLSSTLARARRDPMWQAALAIVDDAVDDSWHDPTGGATHYVRTGERIQWTRQLARTAIIGAHSFYR